MNDIDGGLQWIQTANGQLIRAMEAESKKSIQNQMQRPCCKVFGFEEGVGRGSRGNWKTSAA